MSSLIKTIYIGHLSKLSTLQEEKYRLKLKRIVFTLGVNLTNDVKDFFY